MTAVIWAAEGGLDSPWAAFSTCFNEPESWFTELDSALPPRPFSMASWVLMLVRSVLILPAELALSWRWVRFSSEIRTELTCLQVLWFAVGDPECAGGLVVVPPELVLAPELHAAAIAMTPAITATAAILAGLAVCDCVTMRTCSPGATISTSPPAGEITFAGIRWIARVRQCLASPCTNWPEVL